ncbi:MAG: IS1595 family transposase [Acetobacteraceae bacterium]
METVAFSRWLIGLVTLTHDQRREAFQALALCEAAAVDEPADAPERHGDALAGHLLVADSERGTALPGAAALPRVGADLVADLGQRRVDRTGCPHCDSHDVVRWGKASSLPRYRCKGCRRTFNALTKTPLAHLHKKERWALHTAAMMNGVSTAKAAKRCDVAYTTAFRWRHRFLAALAHDKPTSLSGIVESDETFILESFKGKRSGLARAPRKRGGKPAKTGISAEQIPVLVARDRLGATTDAVLAKLDRVSIVSALSGVVTPANELCCDGGKALLAFARRAGIPVHVLPVPGKPSPQAPHFHINNVNAYHGRLKEWMRRFHGVATKNLPNYLGWRRTLEALGKNATPGHCILGAIGLGPYQHNAL